MPPLKTTEKIIEEFISIHGDRYDYSNVVYKGSNEKVQIGCKIHGDFMISPASHFYKKANCYECGRRKSEKSRTKTLEDFIKISNESHHDKYDYSKSIYNGIKEKIIIVCPEHGEFTQPAGNHMSGGVCPGCYKIQHRERQRMRNFKKFLEKSIILHKNIYNYSNVDYIDASTKVEIICNKHGSFHQTPLHHLRPQMCPQCAKEVIANKKHKGIPTWVYYIYLEDKNLWKIGISKYEDVENKRHLNKNIKVISTFFYEDGLNAWEMEQKIINKYSDKKYSGSKFDGFTECFTEDILKDYYE